MRRTWAAWGWKLNVCVLLLLLSRPLWAGPPFQTDDPEPVPLGHWEFYLASIGTAGSGQAMYTAPHFEVNYGAAPGLQLHLVAPLERSTATGTPAEYGYGDTEIGAKYRIWKQAGARPEIGTFPLIELPTGSAARGLGSGHLQWFLPVWIQESWGGWTSYGGSGYWHNPGAGNRDWNFTGWELQRDLPHEGRRGWVGGEIFHTSASTVGGQGSLALNLGAQINFSTQQHVIFSAGHSLTGPPAGIWYVAYYLTL